MRSKNTAEALPGTVPAVSSARAPAVRKAPSPRRYGGFSLVELVVVITVLAILGTIGFLSLVGYSSSARDSARVSDLANLSKSLELAKTTTGHYPEPSSSTGVTYSGGIVWRQGTAGSSVLSALNSGGYRISEKPTDPAYPGTEYAYSVLENGKEYQIAGAMEGGSTAMGAFGDAAHAGGETLTAYVRGTYNGLMAASRTAGGKVCVLALPSIVLRDTGSASGTSLDSGAPLQEDNLVFHGKANLPAGYAAGSGKRFAYAPLRDGNQASAGSGITAYCDTELPSSTGAIAALAGNLAAIYAASGLAGEGASAPQVSSFAASAARDSVVAGVVNASLGGAKVEVGGTSPQDITASTYAIS